MARKTFTSRNRAFAALVRGRDNIIVTNTVDSAGAVENIVDSAYIAARSIAGTDSASVISLITNNSTTVTSIDSFGALALLDSVAEADFAYNNITHDVYFATSLNPIFTVSHSLTLNAGAGPNHDQRIVTGSAGGGRVSPFQTVTVAKTSRSGNLTIYGAIHTVASLNATFSNNTAGWFCAYQNNISILIPGETNRRTLNALIVVQTTGTFVDNGNGTKTAPFEIKGIMPVTGSGSVTHPDNGTTVSVQNNFYTWDSTLSDTDYVFNHSGAPWGLFSITASAVDYPIWTRVDQDSGFVASIIDSAYVSARAGGGGGGVDSAGITALIDSAYINARVDPFDSAHVLGLVDSAYIQLRDRFQDSSGILAIVDSAYIQSRQNSTVDSATTLTLINSVLDSAAPSRAFTYTYTAGAGQTTFTGADTNNNVLGYSAGNIITFLNGILLIDSDDYVASSGTSIVLNSAASLNDVVNVVKFSADGENLSHQQFKYTVSSPTTTFSGNDDNNNSLSYEAGELQVFLNGILLIDSQDYTASNGASVVLTAPTDSSAVLAVSKYSGSGLKQTATRAKHFVYTLAVPTTTITGADDNSSALSYIQDQIQVFHNGILLIDSADYTAIDGTSIVLETATDSDDTIVVTALRGSLTGGLDSANVLALVGGLDSGLVTQLIDSAYVTARSGGGGGGGTDSATVIALSGELKGGMFRINPQSLSINTTIDSAENAHVAGPISFDSGVVLTINGNLVIS